MSNPRVVALGACTLLTIVLACPGQSRAATPLQWDFEKSDRDWVASPLDKGTQKVALSTAHASHGKSSLAVTGSFPEGFGVTYYPWYDWSDYHWLSFDLYVPKNIPKEFDLLVYLKDKHYYWYQTDPLRSPTTGKPTGALKPGRWLTIKLDISPDSTIWKPRGHRKAWAGATYYPREFGLRFFSHSKWSGTVYIDNVQLTGNCPPLGPIPPGPPKIISTPLKLRANATSVPEYRKFELNFNLDHHYENPYDPSIVDVEGHFTAPNGRKIEIPGFYYQAFKRHQNSQGNEVLIPVGRAFWKVRFAACQTGKYRYYVTVRDALGEMRSPEQSFTATAPADPRGYVRVSKRDPHYFAFDNGQFFFPMGINMRDGGDQAAAQKGTYAFDYYFKRFAEEKLDFVRTWMCAWWGGIEWSAKYHSRFDGLGRYSQYNAWRLDYAFDLAQKYGIFLELTLNSHGQFRRDKFDAEWNYNPFSVKNGGFVASPAMFFTSKLAKKYVEQRYRYIVARWGYSQNLMSWDMVNEVDLTEGYQPDAVAQWHKEMASYLESIDPWKHLVCTHICLYTHGNELWNLPEIDYIQADAYWKRRDVGMNECWRAKQHYDKPFLFIEYGPQTVSLPISAAKWQQDFRVGMWASDLMPAAAPAQFWYNQAWNKYKLWQYQHGLEAFNAGEDRRGLGLKTVSGTAHAANNLPLTVQAMSNGKQGAFYVFSFANMIYPDPSQVPADHRIPSATIRLQGFNDGSYQAQFWNTISGKVIATTPCKAEGGLLVVQTPAFNEDLACKLRQQ